MALNSQHKRVSKNRVSITYDVETNGATEKKELPFVSAVLGNFSGDREDPKEVEDREFIQVDQDNFDDVLGRIQPSLSLKVDNVIEADDSQFEVNLDFESMKDFEPDALVQRIEPLKKLLETRNQLNELLSKADRSRDFEKLLKDILQSADSLSALSSELGVKGEE
ncbi:type VI secretion system contractile sheath small subunit [Pseudoalteromonas sp. McH1-7]|uniref:Type VI secretion system protein ImpB n=1 Tax=Pseudoalteromonas peptidolytica F12-50-A1 TaxID=1315280 RepID=A0A8I0T2X5_9GAMM|nr:MULTISPECIES: type VI secretion system contractile sheath small subunit [Pseudoalteromonas]MBE0344702.1 type VI secretion system protein ImpB [Pseudoalteromonas peptidolytica F12-50-A1]MDW7551248.1 type VI secretion system contractile sheath small subunit [Pseudoalteromonas peptidolytica]NLR14431.1 type VI secretion system contractile sheath small subunit [Pseudoalteromonas peptidolytica]NUZ12289.1 type VI secretion system contractile sheath small subunit [Pseudoalteromonas sp. McH1-7]RRS10